MDNTPETQATVASHEATPVSAQSSNIAQNVSIADGRGGIMGIKAGMTQVYTENGDLQAVTVIDLNPACVITQVKTKESNGYNAVQVGFVQRTSKSTNKPELGRMKKINLDKGFYTYQEFRLPEAAKMDAYQSGSVLSPEFIKVGDLVDLISISKGKGFQGGMKRFHMHGGNKTHGASLNHRSLGSIGNRADPGKCFKNKKMPGQMGNVQTTVQNVKVVGIDLENKLLLVHGSVPGSKSGMVTVRKAIKSLVKKASK